MIEHGHDEPRSRESRDTPTEIYPRALENGGDIELDELGPGGGAAPPSPAPFESAPAPVSAPLVAPATPYDSAPSVLLPGAPYGRAGIEDPLTYAPQPLAPLAPLAPRPAWQLKLDAILRDVGAHGERIGTALLDAFRFAPRQQQVLLVAVGAAVLGLFIVVLGILTFGR